MTRTFFALVATLMMWTSCTASPKAAENITVDTKFTAITAENNVDVYYTPGKSVSIKIEAPKSVINNVKTEVKGVALRIFTQGEIKLNGKEKIKVFVTAPSINAFTVKDNADIHCQTALSVENLAISVSDNADFKAPGINVTSLAASIKDNADIKIGMGGIMAENVAISIQDNAEFSTTAINANELAMTASDNSEIKIKDCGIQRTTIVATDNSEVKLSGKSSIVSYTARNSAEIIADNLIANGGVATASDMSTIRSNVASLQTNLNGDMATIKNRP